MTLPSRVTDTGGGVVVTPNFSFGSQLFLNSLFAGNGSEFGGSLHALDSAVGVVNCTVVSDVESGGDRRAEVGTAENSTVIRGTPAH